LVEKIGEEQGKFAENQLVVLFLSGYLLKFLILVNKDVSE
jgi:hypothetical protein